MVCNVEISRDEGGPEIVGNYIVMGRYYHGRVLRPRYVVIDYWCSPFRSTGRRRRRGFIKLESPGI